MKISDIFSYSGISIKTQKGKSVLTILGVVIGITAIVALNSLTSGFQVAITRQLEQGLSANTLVVTPGGGGFGPFGGGGTPTQLFASDVARVESIGHVTAAVGIMQRQITYPSNITGTMKNYSATLTCVDLVKYAQVYTAFSTSTTGGKGYIPTDNKTIAIGNKLYHPSDVNNTIMFDTGNNVTLQWRNLLGANLTYSAEVTGILGKIGGFSLMGGPSDNGIYISFERGQQIFVSDLLSSIVVLIDATDDATVKEVSDAIRAKFNNGVSVLSSTSLLGTVTQALDLVSILLTAIAAISLVVAGIGIMNIMTVSIMERTREIGILKALGTKDREIMGIFLVEALLVGLIGSLIGIGLGYLGSLGLLGLLGNLMGGGGGFAAGITPVLSPLLIIEAISFGVIDAVVFGLYPAAKAARKPPVEALRAE